MQTGHGAAGTVEGMLNNKYYNKIIITDFFKPELQHGTVQAVIQTDQTTEVTDQVPNQSEDSVNMTNV